MQRALQSLEELDVPDYLMAHVHAGRRWYLTPDTSYSRLEEYIDALCAALAADVRAYQAEVAASEAAHRKPRREALKVERAAAPAPTSDSVGARPARARVREADAKRIVLKPRFAGLVTY